MIKRIVNSLFSQVAAQKEADKEAALYKAFLKHEARVGGKIFGSVRENGRRDFFCLDENTWVWHEEWTDQDGQRQVMATRYEVRPNEVLKSQNGSQYKKVSDAEVRRLTQAARLYVQQVTKEVYGRIH